MAFSEKWEISIKGARGGKNKYNNKSQKTNMQHEKKKLYKNNNNTKK